MTTDHQLLQRCGQQCLAAADGRGRRWAVARCQQGLVDIGTPPALATATAQAVADLAVYIKQLPGVKRDH